MSDLAIVLPCLNEGHNLGYLLPKIKEVIATMAVEAEIYVIDGGSTDDTVDVARSQGVHVLSQRGTGYGGAIRTAFEDIRATWLLTMDADFSHHPVFIKYLYARRNDAEIVIASRYMTQGYGEMPWTRKLLSGSLNWVFGRVLDINIRDLSSGFRLYHRNAIVNLKLQYDTYAVLQEILIKSYSQGYRVIEEPFHYLPRRHGSSHARVFKFGVVYLKALFTLWGLRNSIRSADYDTRAFYSRIPLQRWWQRERYRIIRDFTEDKMRILDSGCGSTQILNAVPQTIGMDVQHNKLRYMRRPARALVNASIFDLPFCDASFEVIISSQVIEHVPESPAIFSEVARCLEPGGIYILGTPDYGRWQWPVIEKLYAFAQPNGYADEHITHYSLQSLQEHLKSHGFEIIAYKYILGAELIIKAQKCS